MGIGKALPVLNKLGKNHFANYLVDKKVAQVQSYYGDWTFLFLTLSQICDNSCLNCRSFHIIIYLCIVYVYTHIRWIVSVV